jgi:hypothetical protein
VEHQEATRISIVPDNRNSTTGQMWIIYSDDAVGGIQYVIRLLCALRPEFFPAEK